MKCTSERTRHKHSPQKALGSTSHLKSLERNVISLGGFLAANRGLFISSSTSIYYPLSFTVKQKSWGSAFWKHNPSVCLSSKVWILKPHQESKLNKQQHLMTCWSSPQILPGSHLPPKGSSTATIPPMTSAVVIAIWGTSWASAALSCGYLRRPRIGCQR